MDKTQKNQAASTRDFANKLNDQYRRRVAVLPTITASEAKARKALPPITAPPADKYRVPWRETTYLPMKIAGAVGGFSVASVYRFADEGKLELRTLAGRTLVVTKSLIALLDGAEAWKPTNRGAAARAKRREFAQASRTI